MILTHLRRNVVAYLALCVALSTGTAYAAGLADGSVTNAKLAKNAVTSSKIKASAVRSPDIKDRSVAAVDLDRGLVPGDGLIAAAMVNAGPPSATPTFSDQYPRSFVLPRKGRVYLRYAASVFGIDCSSGDGSTGLFVDGEPLPGTGVFVGSTGSQRAVDVVDYISLTAGTHTASISLDCASGTFEDAIAINATWTVMMVAE